MIRELSEIVGISGREEDVLNLISHSIYKEKFNIYRDKIGNMFVTQSKNLDEIKTAFVASVDETGIMASDITEDGYIKFQTIGHVKSSSLISKKVSFNDVNGIISAKAVHLLSDEDKKKETDPKNLLVDIGAKDKKDAQKYVKKGDFASFDVSFKEQGDKYFGKALKGRIAVSVFIDIINESLDIKKDCAFVFAVQSQINYRGLRVALNQMPSVNNVFLSEGVDLDNVCSGAVLGITKDETESTGKTRNKLTQIAFENNIAISKSFVNDKINVPVNILGYPILCENTPVNVAKINDVYEFRKLIKVLAQKEI